MKPRVIATLSTILVLTGCSGTSAHSGPSRSDPTSAQSTTTAASPTAPVRTIPPDVHIVMTPGAYQTVAFSPAFTFRTRVTLGGGADVPDVANFSLKIYDDSYFAGMVFVRFDKVCDPSAPDHLTAPPAQLVGCLTHNPHLRVTAKPQPVTIAGVSGQRLDVDVVGKLSGPSSCNGDPHPCVRIGTTPNFPPAADGGFGAPGEAKYSFRIWILDVHGTQVAVFWSDLTDQFASNISTAEAILKSVQFS